MAGTVERPITACGRAMPMRGKLRSGLVQCLDGKVDAGVDHAAQIVAGLVHHVERGGGAEIHHDQRPAETPVAGERIEQAVGTHFRRAG